VLVKKEITPTSNNLIFPQAVGGGGKGKGVESAAFSPFWTRFIFWFLVDCMLMWREGLLNENLAVKYAKNRRQSLISFFHSQTHRIMNPYMAYLAWM